MTPALSTAEARVRFPGVRRGIRPMALEPLREGDLAQLTSAMQHLTAACHYDRERICRLAAERIVAGTTGGDELAEVRAIFDFVKARVRYTRDPSLVEYLQDPRALLWVIDQEWLAYGDCDDQAMLTTELGLQLRLPCVWVFTSDEPGLWNHVYAAMRVGSTSRRWLYGDDAAESGLLCLDTADSTADFDRHPRGVCRRYVVEPLA